jgi:pimeloyl-ACP methyl ester carboxylesterase
MSPVRIVRSALALAVALLVAGPTPGLAQKKRPDAQSVVIPTADGARLAATLYPNPGGRRDAVVVFLHHFDARKGGSSADAGWFDLAAELVADGYVVLAFDFRGFGDSQEVDAKRFWSQPHNRTHLTRRPDRGVAPDLIRHDLFKASYFPYLVNDVAAVKAYLDRENDARRLNSANVILIGAGDGATVGALWLAHEARRRRSLAAGKRLVRLGDPEVNHVTAAVWLAPTPAIGSRPVNPAVWCEEAGLHHRVPMAFVHGQHDGPGENLAIRLLRTVRPGGPRMPGMQNTCREAIAGTALRGAALLDRDLGTVDFLKTYLAAALNQRRQPWALKNHDTSAYYYTEGDPPRAVKTSKAAGEEACAVDVGRFLP